MLKKTESLRIQGDYENLVRLNKDYLNIAEENKYKEGVILCYINISNISATIGNYKRGLSYLSLAEKELKAVDSHVLKARLYQEHAQLNYVIGLYKSALEFNAKGLYYLKSTSESDKRKYYLYRLYANRAECLYKANKTDSAYIYLQKGQKVDSRGVLLNTLLAKHHLLYTKRLDSALIYLQKASQKIVNTGKVNVQSGFVYLTYGDYYYELKDYNTALSYYKKALDNYNKTNRLYNIPGAYESIANTYKMLNEPEKEAEARQRYREEKVDLENIQNEAINISIDQMLNDKDEESLGFEKKIYLFGSVIIILCVIIFLLLYTHNRSLRQRKNEFKSEALSLKSKINDSFDELVNLAKKNDSTFLTRFQEIYPDFCPKLLEINSKLGASELAFCAMIKLNFTSKEIAEYTFIQHKSVQQKKHRLRKKLDVPSDQELFIFFDSL
ncbi:tetratricopeptide repeat protein [Chryseobacterium phosphatilyticum]|uniref:tetratricopeptide repeat protein n=1 Tax=Chryseobacterium phosphatilyticum TaxID=475075 RepID=UPI001401DAA5|nr:tetratricopeptide repeat protein [Chryseobacterium phosphatilyticum]